MKIFKSKLTWICLIMAGLFIYGKYFVDITEIAKLSSTMSIYVWIILGIIMEMRTEIMEKIGKKK